MVRRERHVAMATQTYPLSIVADVIRVTEHDLTNWVRRGHLDGVLSFGRGRERRLTSKGVIAAAYIKCFVDMGLTVGSAAAIARQTGAGDCGLAYMESETHLALTSVTCTLNIKVLWSDLADAATLRTAVEPVAVGALAG